MLSIVIPIYNQHAMTQECLQAVAANTKDYELVIIDNGSVPPFSPPSAWVDVSTIGGEKKFVPGNEGYGNITIISNEKNLGFPVAVNQGIRAAKGDVVVLLNNDVIVTPQWFKPLIDRLDTFAIVGPMTNYCAGKQQITISLYENEQELNELAKEFTAKNLGKSLEVNFVIGFCMVFRKTLWEELGPFDESIWPSSGEEIDFCFRARKAGYRVGIAQDVYMHHEGSKTFLDMDKAKEVDYQKLCSQTDNNIARKWGDDFWSKQAILEKPTPENQIRLNMGSGPFPLKGFINIDQFPEVKPDIVCDCRAVPYELGTVDEIYAGHILEHFHYPDGLNVLKYWFGLLKPGGIIGVAVPDFDFLVKEYVINPTAEKLIIMNDTYIYSYIQPSPHKYAYSAALLKKVLEDTGFVDIKRMEVNHPYFPHAVEWQVGYTGTKP